MLLIRETQFQIFQDALSLEFETRLYAHLCEGFTRQMGYLGEAKARALIRFGVQKANLYGYSNDRDVYLFLCLMLMLGSHFDQDPQLPWVRDHLTLGRPQGSEANRSSLLRLHQATLDYLDIVAGENNEYLVKALLRLRDFDTGRFRKFETGEKALTEALAGLCEEWYPQKAKHQGETSTRQALTLAIQPARMHGMNTSYALGVFGGLTFMLGLGFEKDLQFPWALAALSSAPGGEAKAKELYAGAMAYLQFGLTGE